MAEVTMKTVFEANNAKKKVLMQLINCGAATARELSKRTAIPKNKVYELLKDLRTRNLVYALPKMSYRTETVYGIRKGEMLDHLSRWKGLLEEGIAECNLIERKIKESKRSSTLLIKPEIWIGSRRDSEGKTIEMMKKAKRSIYISTYTFSWFDKVKTTLLEKANAAVDIRVLMADPSSRKLFSFENRRMIQDISKALVEAGIKVRYSKNRLPFRGTIVDKSILLIMAFPYLHEKDVDMTTGYYLCNNQALVRSIVGFFDRVFSSGGDVSTPKR